MIPEKRSPLEMYLEVTTPVFTPEMGKRMRLARMKLMLDQSELGLRLGLSQQQVSKLEGGDKLVEESVSTAKFKEAFGDTISFILFGTGEDRFGSSVVTKYWDEKHSKQGNRTEKMRFWEKKTSEDK